MATKTKTDEAPAEEPAAAPAPKKATPITLLNTEHPFLRVIVDPNGPRARQFDHGKLVVGDDDPDREFLLAFANASPEIRVVTTAVWCPECGTPFAGGSAHALLAEHRKEFHFEAWIGDKEAELAEERNIILTERSGIPCPICARQNVGLATERFPDAASLAVHSQVIHGDQSAAPALDEQGNTIGAQD